MTQAERVEYEKLKAENEALKARMNKALSMKVGEKGGVSVYGLGRFPVTLYAEQWARLINASEQIIQFIKDHQGELSVKKAA